MNMATGETVSAQQERAIAFREMHTSERPLLLANVWDALSARVAVAAGAAAIGTTSFGIALSHGVNDGEVLAFDEVVTIARNIVGAVDVPVTIDLEAGRGSSADGVAAAVTDVVAAGAVGVNIEDSIPGQAGQLFEIAEQVERLTAARAAADAAGIPVYINARCDVYFGASVIADRMLEETLTRARAYRGAGADGLFLPGLVDLNTIATVATNTDFLLNVMVSPGLPSFDDLAAPGVRRISQGGSAFLAVTGVLTSLTRDYLGEQLHPPMEALGNGLSVLPSLLQ